MVRQILFTLAVAVPLSAAPDIGYKPPAPPPRPQRVKTPPAARKEFVAPALPRPAIRVLELPAPPVPEIPAWDFSVPALLEPAPAPSFPQAAAAPAPAKHFLFWKRKSGRDTQ